MKIRQAVPDDAPAVVALRATVYPYLVRGVESTRRMIAQPPPDEHWAAFVAQRQGELVGWVSAYLNTNSSARVGEISLPHVHPDHRGRGAGSALVAVATEHVEAFGVRRLRTWATPEGLDFARRRGFEPSREARYSALELRQPPTVPAPPAGIRLASLAELDDKQVYAAHAAAVVDEPNDVPNDALAYDAWRTEIWENVGLDHQASTAALVGETVAGFTLVIRDGERMWSAMTGTRPEHRGRGLALLVKSAALRRAAEDGVTAAYTGNDAANGPMLAVNARLGYRPVGSQWSCVKPL
ncbi:GNAT family N-acetyltransferase [Solwaraspora sp. WMMD1047]|uniref:GNAT family N-acetyltransferase n=1 Tax=Solwaraspora sp. WMMD1047 TaxID=3016102 RepID=UPI00241745B5|nr:GNAT family N-acetyltransferase [Solwaraspora sp. WMMD1047]MDG4834588.1 GNAT family N-acetyltransferase [Solwaraspora sp. WMMD1047]